MLDRRQRVRVRDLDAADAGPAAAALREAEEEIGLCRQSADLLGYLPGLLTGTGFHVTPVVTHIAGTPSFRPAPAEVASIFTLDFATLLDPAAPRRQTAQLAGRTREFWVWPHREHHIWGATGVILMSLAKAMAGLCQ